MVWRGEKERHRKAALKKYRYKGTTYYYSKSNRKNKQLKTFVNGKPVHFGDSRYPEYPGTKRGDNYCARSAGINTNNPSSPNFHSRRILWNCQGTKSQKERLKGVEST